MLVCWVVVVKSNDTKGVTYLFDLVNISQTTITVTTIGSRQSISGCCKLSHCGGGISDGSGYLSDGGGGITQGWGSITQGWGGITQSWGRICNRGSNL